jgi:Flp pilus assembly pilin Flp
MSILEEQSQALRNELSMPNLLRSGISAIARQDGATAVEYALMVALIALAIIGAVTALGLVLPGWFQPATDGLLS